MSSEITELEDEDSYFITNKEAQKNKIRQLLQYQKNHYNSSSSSSTTTSSTTKTTSCSSYSFSSFDRNKSRKLLNLMKKGSTSLRRLFDMEHTSLGNHFQVYSGSPETKTIPLWGSDSDETSHGDPWLGILKFDHGLVQEVRHDEVKKQEHEEEKEESLFRKNKLSRKKSFSKLPSLYKFRFRIRLKLRFRFCYRIWGKKKKKHVNAKL